MSLLSYIQQNNTVRNTKGGLYYSTTYNANLDLFAGVSRNQDEPTILVKFDEALAENETLALANLLLLLDVRGGKGERRLFKTCYKFLCQKRKDLALKILPLIPELGRWDYVLEGIGTPIQDETLALIKEQLYLDRHSPTPSLLAKWLPSHRSHGKNNPLAKEIYTYLRIDERQYRKILKEIRDKLRLIENNLTNRDYDIDFERVPTKAMLKYRKAFQRNCLDDYSSYLEAVASGDKKINTNGLYCYEIVQKIFKGASDELSVSLLDNMWNNQKDFLKGNESNILVMADTSGSMTWDDNIPLANSIGLAIYTAERNHGYFHDYFLTFSDEPRLQKVQGSNIYNKVENIDSIVANTDIDKAFKLILEAGVEQDLPQSEMPSHIIIISDMEFDAGCYCTGKYTYDSETIPLWPDDPYNYISKPREAKTNLSGWRDAFKDEGYTLPKVIFWNVATRTHGLPATKYDNDIAMVSGFSPFILENILEPEKITPEKIMLETLSKYLDLLEK